MEKNKYELAWVGGVFALKGRFAVTGTGALNTPPEPVGAGGDKGDGDADGNSEGDSTTGVATKSRSSLKRPSLYRVLLLNDDYTPMEFVIEVLQEIFKRNREDAFQIMMHVHKNGVGECGVFPFEIAETKVTRVMDAARKNQHPLQCVMEKQ